MFQVKSWTDDNDWQKGIRDRFLAPFYQQRAYEGRFVFFEKGTCSTLIQKRLAVDTAFQPTRDITACVEEKIVRKPHEAFFFEVQSCSVPGHESLGWMHYAEADVLLYVFLHSRDGKPAFLDAYAFHFPALKEWFWSLDLEGKYRLHTMYTSNRTQGRLVPIDDVRRYFPNSKIRRFIIAGQGRYELIDLHTSSAFLDSVYQRLVSPPDDLNLDDHPF